MPGRKHSRVRTELSTGCRRRWRNRIGIGSLCHVDRAEEYPSTAQEPSTPSWLGSELLRDGITPRDLRAMTVSGEWTRLRRGSYLSRENWDRMDAAERHRVRAGDIGRQLVDGAAISHLSAAVVHGLPIPPMTLPRVHVTWPMSPGRRGTTNIHPHRGRVDAADLTVVDGIPVTDIARTVFDVARASGPRTAVAVADGALRLKRCGPADLVGVLDRYRNTPGGRSVAQIVDFADGRSDSVGESISRVQFAQIGLPAPDLQARIANAEGEIFAQVDFEFTGLGTVGEFDGRQKYVRLLRPGQTPSDVVFAEKVREDRIRDTGREVVRLVWDDLNRNIVVLARFRAAFARAGHPEWRPGFRRFVTKELVRESV